MSNTTVDRNDYERLKNERDALLARVQELEREVGRWL